jgi:hypothetical protein
MVRNIDFSKPKTQYFLGLALNLLFLFIIYSFDTSYDNTQIPIGIYKHNIWECSDVMTYVEPAKNFIEHGVFGINNNPDHFRTIGYPSFISFFQYFFGENWVIALQLFQTIIFAFIYPIITATVKIILPNFSGGLSKILFISLCISGGYFTRSAMILTDMFFTLLFVSGFYFGLKSYISNKKYNLLLYLLFITIAALMRPTLTFFPFLNLSIGYWVAKKYTYPIKRTMMRSIILSIVILSLINISSLRNYFNHSFFSPSSVIGLNSFEYLSKKVLTLEGKTDQYNQYKEKLNIIDNISIKTKMRKTIMYNTIIRYPLSTIKVLSINTVNLFLSNNLLSNISTYFGYDAKTYKSSCYTFKISNILYYSTYIFMLLYFTLWSLFLLKLINLWKQKDYETIFIIFILFIMFMVPAILTGDGGSRFRLPFEHILFIFSLSMISEKIDRNYKNV